MDSETDDGVVNSLLNSPRPTMSLPPPPVFLEGIGYVPPDEAEVIVANLERQNSLNLGQKNIIDENNVSDITIDSNVSIDVSCIIDINDQSAVIPENSAEELEQDEEEKNPN